MMLTNEQAEAHRAAGGLTKKVDGLTVALSDSEASAVRAEWAQGDAESAGRAAANQAKKDLVINKRSALEAVLGVTLEELKDIMSEV